MRRRRRRGGTNALNSRKTLKPESTSLSSVTLENVAQLHPQEERREEPGTSWPFRSKQHNDEMNGLRRRLRTWKTRQGVKINNPSVKGKSRPRSIRFSSIESMTLVSKLVPVYEQLLGKYKSRTSVIKKCQMWQEICDAVNNVGNKQRFVRNCKKRFHDMKKQLRNKINKEKSLLGDHSGCSPLQVCYTQYEEELKKVLPAEVIDGVEFFESDHPQDLCPEEDAGPSWGTPENVQLPMKALSSRELHNVSVPEELRRAAYIRSVDEYWSTLPDLSSAFSLEPSTLRSTNLSADHIDLQPGHPLDSRKPKLHPNGYSIEQPSPLNFLNPTPTNDAHLLKALKTTEKLFQKGMKHSLNVLRSDVGHFNRCIEESNSIAEHMLRVQGERNSVLHQMNIQLGKLAESLEQLANQQQAEQILCHDFPRRGGRLGGNHQAEEVRRSLKAASAMTCLSESGFLLGTNHSSRVE